MELNLYYYLPKASIWNGQIQLNGGKKKKKSNYVYTQG